MIEMNKKEIYLLIGQKGSGKSFVGKIFNDEFNVKFIRVEDWVRQIRKDQDVFSETYLKQVFETIEKGIREALLEIDRLVFESTGLSSYFDKMLEGLKKDFHVTTIGIYADSKICLNQVRARDKTIHINISDDQVSLINEKVKARNLLTDFRIDNETKTEKELIREIRTILETVKINRI
ncbi:MAG: hypothetical protein A2W91_20650 [Bacteroidetes bacterium GWF2_38_335]|nr:MAG: hypothetical protein A2W91_20650 [Bacteroidetes bacterium GWF2_38_335]OFY80759.1 MAG: hypothetical protein A2281_17085 [Bacteroidetes bacterium RIFOXYA12_FULL_38_20]